MQLVEGIAEIENLDAFLAALAEISEKTDCAVQAFDARYVMGREHVERAVELANRAFDRGENVARDRAVEVLLFAAGRRQIDRALEMGVSEGEGPVVVVVDSSDGDAEAEAEAVDGVRALLQPAETLGMEHTDEGLVREFFDVSAVELEATAGGLVDLVLERVALLVVER